jgi:hypothetical protein
MQRGRGIGSLFSGLFRSLRPLASMGLKVGKRILNSDLAKKVGSTALEFGKEALTNVAADVLDGKSFKDSANEQLADAKARLAQTLRGGGKRRRNKKRKRYDSDSQDSISSEEDSKKRKKKIKRTKKYNLLNL